MGIFEGHFTNWPASHREGGKLFYHPQGSRSHTLSYIALHHDLCWWGLHDRLFFLILLRGYVDLSQIRGIKKSWYGLLQEEDTWNLLGFPQFTVPSVLPLLSPPTNPDPSYTNSWLIPWISSVVPIKLGGCIIDNSPCCSPKYVDSRESREWYKQSSFLIRSTIQPHRNYPGWTLGSRCLLWPPFSLLHNPSKVCLLLYPFLPRQGTQVLGPPWRGNSDFYSFRSSESLQWNIYKATVNILINLDCISWKTFRYY